MCDEMKIPLVVLGCILCAAITVSALVNTIKHFSNKQTLQCFELLKDRSTTDLTQLCGKVY